MHELVFVDRILEEAAKYGKVKRAVVEVGDLAQIDADHLQDALRARAAYGIDVIGKKARVNCECGYDGEPDIVDRGHDFVLYECPDCKGIPHIMDGELVKLIHVEVE